MGSGWGDCDARRALLLHFGTVVLKVGFVFVSGLVTIGGSGRAEVVSWQWSVVSSKWSVVSWQNRRLRTGATREWHCRV